MKIYRFENKYHFGPFFSHFTEPYPTKDLPASDDLFDYDANISYRNKFGRSAPPSNYHVFGCTDKNQLIQDFKDHLDILSDSDFRISEYETDDFAYVDGVVCFDAVRSKLIHQYDVYGNMLNSMIANFDEFIEFSSYFAQDMLYFLDYHNFKMYGVDGTNYEIINATSKYEIVEQGFLA